MDPIVVSHAGYLPYAGVRVDFSPTDTPGNLAHLFGQVLWFVAVAFVKARAMVSRSRTKRKPIEPRFLESHDGTTIATNPSSG